MSFEERWVGIDNVASHLQLTRKSIYRWVDTKRFPACRVERLLRFRLSKVDEEVRKGSAEEASNGRRARATI